VAFLLFCCFLQLYGMPVNVGIKQCKDEGKQANQKKILKPSTPPAEIRMTDRSFSLCLCLKES
jgi:hypothetical protein